MRDRTPLDLGNYLPYLVNRVGVALVARFTAEALREQKLSIDMWRVLAALANCGGSSQVALSNMTSIDVSTMSRLVSRLAQRQLLTRRRAAASNREVVVVLTPKGRALVGRLTPIARRLERTAGGGISAKEMALAKRLLTRMYGNLASPGGTSARHR